MKRFNRIAALFLSILLLLTALPLVGMAAEPVNVSVTLSVRGQIAQGQKDGQSIPIAGVLVSVSAENPTVQDVLLALHDAYYPGGAAEGYATGPNPYGSGLSMTKLWGQTEGVGGFYCNGVMPWTTVDATPVAEGDQITVVVYRPDWSDSYAYFDRNAVTTQPGETVSLTLRTDVYDTASSTFVPTPLPGVQLVLISEDGTAVPMAGAVTDENGQVAVSFETAGQYLVSIQQGETALTAPVCKIQVTDGGTPVTPPAGTSDWPSFRGNENNMGVTHAKTPTATNGLWAARQKWAVCASAFAQFGAYSWAYPTTAILVNDSVIAASGDQLKKINRETGAVEQTVTMAGSREYAYLPPVYGDGMLFVSLNGGVIQAFDSQTLTSLWVSEGVGGQALSALTYADGYLYTGFYNGETKDGAFLCLSVIDEDPEQQTETKQAVWETETPGGYYWTGAYCRGDYVVVAAENGAAESETTAEGTLYVRNRYNGELVDSAPIVGDGRSAVACDTASGRLYFTTKAGYLYRFTLSDMGEIQSLQSCAYEGESTSTPVVCNGRVYFGVGNQVIAADADTLELLDQVELPGRCQGALLLSDATLEETGSVFLYATYNAAPGELMVIEDGADGLHAQTLFTPAEDQQNYCLSSPICGADGVIYYTNDSGYLFAIERGTVEHCPVVFSLSPDGASLSLTDPEGQAVSPLAPAQYDLPAGTYQWTAAKEGYRTKTGRLLISEEEASLHTLRTETVVLSKKNDPWTGPTAISISFALFGDTQHDASVQHSYRQNSQTLPQWIPSESQKVLKGTTAYEVLISALEEADLFYEVSQTGYVSSINGLAEQANGPRSGWMYQVNGKIPQVSSTNYVLKNGDVLVWFYTDDYQLEGDSLPLPKPSEDPLPSPSVSPEPSPDPAVPFPFADVPETHWARGYVEQLVQENLVKGKDEQHFAPDDLLTRSEFVTLLYRLAGAKGTGENAPFSDVSPDDWYGAAVSWAVEQGITKGVSADRFAPDLTIAREDMALMVLRFADSMPVALPQKQESVSYVDEGEIREDAKEAVLRLSQAEICNGVGGGRFAPKDGSTRAEAAKLLCLLQNLIKQG